MHWFALFCTACIWSLDEAEFKMCVSFCQKVFTEGSLGLSLSLFKSDKTVYNVYNLVNVNVNL